MRLPNEELLRDWTPEHDLEHDPSAMVNIRTGETTEPLDDEALHALRLETLLEREPLNIVGALNG